MLTPGVVTAAADEIRMTIDQLRDIAHSKLPGLKADASQSRDRFRNLHLPAGAFSDFPEAQVVQRQHEGAHEVFVETINGVIADLEDFEQRLRASVASAEATDEQVEASLVALGNRLSRGDHVFASTQIYDRSRREHAADLSAGREAEPTTDPAPADPTQHTTPDPTPDTPSGSPTTGETF